MVAKSPLPNKVTFIGSWDLDLFGSWRGGGRVGVRVSIIKLLYLSFTEMEEIAGTAGGG